jgi:precorrin-6B methylase 2
MDYAQLPAHRWMLRDETRTAAFQKAIAAVVKPGDTVIDVGAGTGVLSMMAARAGAKRVIGVELTSVASVAAHLVQLNGLSDRVTILQGDVRGLQPAERADVIVSEWMGTVGVEENMLGAVLWARDHFLKPGGKLIPAKVTALLAPVATDLRADIGFFRNRPYGLDLGPLAEPWMHELLMCRRRIRAADLAAPPQELWTTDAAADPPSVLRRPFEAELGFTIGKRARLSALAAWFSSELAPGIVLTNAPDAPETHWGQMMLPLDRQVELERGARIEARVSARAVGPGPLMFRWSVRIDGGAWEEHDTAAEGSGESAQPAEPKRSALSAFLAELAVEPEQLRGFYTDPDSAMEKAGLPEPYRAALKSRDPMRIAQALFEAGAAG